MNKEKLEAQFELFFLEFYKLYYSKILSMEIKPSKGRDLPAFPASVCMDGLRELAANLAAKSKHFRIMLTDRGSNLKIDITIKQEQEEYSLHFEIRDNTTANRPTIMRGKKRVKWEVVFSQEVIATLQAEGFLVN